MTGPNSLVRLGKKVAQNNLERTSMSFIKPTLLAGALACAVPCFVHAAEGDSVLNCAPFCFDQAGEVSYFAGALGRVVFDSDDGHLGQIFEAAAGVSYSGFFAEAWLGTLIDDPADDFEYELSAGYGGPISDQFEYGVWLTGYYLNNSGYQNYDVTGGLYYEFDESFSSGFELAWDPDTDDLNKAIVFGWAANDQISFEGEFGDSDADDNQYYELSALYDFGKGVSTGLFVEGASDASTQVSLLIAFDFEK